MQPLAEQIAALRPSLVRTARTRLRNPARVEDAPRPSAMNWASPQAICT